MTNKQTVPAQRMGELAIDAGSWVKRSQVHTIEHLITATTSDSTLITACGNRMQRGPAVPGNSPSGSPYRCVKCGEAEEMSERFESAYHSS